MFSFPSRYRAGSTFADILRDMQTQGNEMRERALAKIAKEGADGLRWSAGDDLIHADFFLWLANNLLERVEKNEMTLEQAEYTVVDECLRLALGSVGGSSNPNSNHADLVKRNVAIEILESLGVLDRRGEAASNLIKARNERQAADAAKRKAATAYREIRMEARSQWLVTDFNADREPLRSHLEDSKAAAINYAKEFAPTKAPRVVIVDQHGNVRNL